jgi:lipid II:glycine glycyltransferase (peptidoglycan interpeptide bridge formation enzyme)
MMSDVHVLSAQEWEHFLERYPEAHFLQKREWGELKAGFGWEVVRFEVEGSGAQVLFRRLPLGWSIGYLPKGPLFPGSQPPASFWAALDRVCRRKRAIFCTLEADRWEHEGGFAFPPPWRPSPRPIQPPRTLVVDLRGSEAEILGRMKQKTRYNIRLAEKKGVSVRPWQDLEAFHRLMEVTGQRDGFGVHSLEYYRRAWELFHPSGQCELLMAEYAAQPLAALMVFRHGRRAWYVYGASSDRERNRMPTYLLQWEAMRWARAQGAEEYDLWGVPDADEATLEAHFTERQDGLWGVYRFKRGFGGELRRALQAHDRVYAPALYAFIRYLQRGVS